MRKGRREISIIKGHIINSKGAFDGDGYSFKQAIRELRKEGLTITLNRQTWMYENKTKKS